MTFNIICMYHIDWHIGAPLGLKRRSNEGALHKYSNVLNIELDLHQNTTVKS